MNRTQEEQLVLFADGDLPDSERAAVEAWIEHSPEARTRLGEYEESLARFTEALGNPPSEVVEKPWRGLEAIERSLSFRTLQRAVMAAAAVALVSGTLFLAVHESGTPSDKTRAAQTPPGERVPDAHAQTDFEAEQAALLARIEALEHRAAALEARLSLQETLNRAHAEETAALHRAMGQRWERQFGDAVQAARHYDAVLRGFPDTEAAREISQEINKQGA